MQRRPELLSVGTAPLDGAGTLRVFHLLLHANPLRAARLLPVRHSHAICNWPRADHRRSCSAPAGNGRASHLNIPLNPASVLHAMLDERVLRIPTERLRELHAVHGLAKAGHFTVDDLFLPMSLPPAWRSAVGRRRSAAPGACIMLHDSLGV